MKKTMAKHKASVSGICTLLVLLCSLNLTGCGYTLQNKSALPFSSINIGKIENATVEPKLQDVLSRALTDEFLKRGVDVTRESGYTLNAVIRKFELVVLAEKSDIASEYEVKINANFTLIDPSGKQKDIKNISSPFIVAFPTTDSQLNELIATKELAAEKAIKDIAMEIVGILLYQ